MHDSSFGRRREAVGQTAEGAIHHLTATILPFGERARDLWIRNGRFTLEPQVGGKDLVSGAGFVAPGLVDSHTHIHFLPEAVGRQGRSLIDENRRQHLDAGTLLLRDLGATTDEILTLPDDDGLPIVHAAGRS